MSAVDIQAKKRLVMNATSKAVRQWRLERGLSVGHLASAIGITPSYLSKLEEGFTPFTHFHLYMIAEVLDVTLDELSPTTDQAAQ